MLTAERLRELLHYNPRTGIFKWLVSRGTQKAGALAGCLDSGYWKIRVENFNYQGARLAHLYMTGEWPPSKMDHKNRKTADNRWTNLRPANNSQNGFNSVSRRIAASGVRGLDWSPRHKKWRVRITHQRQLITVGFFRSKSMARKAWTGAAKRLHGEFARG